VVSLVLISSMWGPESIRREMWARMDPQGGGRCGIGVQSGRVYSEGVVARVGMHLLVVLHEACCFAKETKRAPL
jgi:hypothetical protein